MQPHRLARMEANVGSMLKGVGWVASGTHHMGQMENTAASCKIRGAPAGMENASQNAPAQAHGGHGTLH